MRRILAIALLIAFGSPLVAPIFAATADPEASLPPCCRSHGAHHCAMMHMRAQSTSSGPAFTPPPCPLYPTPATPSRIGAASLATPLQLIAAHLATPAPPTRSASHPARNFLPSANLKRGPPTLAA